MIPFVFDSSMGSVMQWLPALMAGIALISSQMFGRAA
jgi:hypothetical protein